MNRIRLNISRVLAVCVLMLAALSVSAEIPFSTGLLFKVQKGRGAPNYLFGTMHSDDPRVRKLVTQLAWALAKSRILAVEVEPDELAAISLVSRMVDPAGNDLHKTLGDRLFLQAVEQVRRLGLPEMAINHYKPWALAVLFSLPPLHGEVADQYIVAIARKQGKSVIGLETIDEQLSAFDELPLTDQNTMLIHALNNVDQMPMIYQQLTESYLARDLGELLRISEQNFDTAEQAQIERFQKALIDSRNRRMLERLKEQILSGGVFVAVGALHLPGERGLLNLLLDQGFSVETVY